MQQIRITEIDDALGIVLPREILKRLRVKEGDALYVVETPNGIELTPHLEYARQMTIATKGMRKYCRALDELAE